MSWMRGLKFRLVTKNVTVDSGNHRVSPIIPNDHRVGRGHNIFLLVVEADMYDVATRALLLCFLV